MGTRVLRAVDASCQVAPAAEPVQVERPGPGPADAPESAKTLDLLSRARNGDVASANALFGLASTRGLLSVVSVLAQLYPIATVLLARLVLHERISRPQQVGVAAAFGGVALITAG